MWRLPVAVSRSVSSVGPRAIIDSANLSMYDQCSSSSVLVVTQSCRIGCVSAVDEEVQFRRSLAEVGGPLQRPHSVDAFAPVMGPLESGAARGYSVRIGCTSTQPT